MTLRTKNLKLLQHNHSLIPAVQGIYSNNYGWFSY